MPPKRRRRFQGLYYHSSPPKVLPMNGQIANSNGRRRPDPDDLSVKLSTIRIWMHEKDIGKLTRVLWAGQGNRLRQQASTNPKVKRFLTAVPHVMNSIKDVHQAVIDNSLENLQSNLEPPVPPALVTCRDANGLNLIHKAAGLGHATILEYLITTWPDGVHETDITGKTPLHWAASAKNNMRCYTLLTQAGCDEEAVDYKMKTPSFYRHKPHEIERAFLTYVPEAPRVSPDVATDWEALSDDSGDGKKLDIKIPEMNGFGRHSNAESNENTSEAEMTEAASGHEDEEMSKDGEENENAEPAVENDEDHEEAADEEAESKDAPEDTEEQSHEENEEEKTEEDEEEPTDAKEDNEEQEKETQDEQEEEDNNKDEEPQDEKQQTETLNETTANLTKDSEDAVELESKTEKENNESNESNGHKDENENDKDNSPSDDLKTEIEMAKVDQESTEKIEHETAIPDEKPTENEIDENNKDTTDEKKSETGNDENSKESLDEETRDQEIGEKIKDSLDEKISEPDNDEKSKESLDENINGKDNNEKSKEALEDLTKIDDEKKANDEEKTDDENKSDSEIQTGQEVNNASEENVGEVNADEEHKENGEDKEDSKTIGEALVGIKDEVKDNVKYLATQIKNVFNGNDGAKEEEIKNENDDLKTLESKESNDNKEIAKQNDDEKLKKDDTQIENDSTESKELNDNKESDKLKIDDSKTEDDTTESKEFNDNKETEKLKKDDSQTEDKETEIQKDDESIKKDNTKIDEQTVGTDRGQKENEQKQKDSSIEDMVKETESKENTENEDKQESQTNDEKINEITKESTENAPEPPSTSSDALKTSKEEDSIKSTENALPQAQTDTDAPTTIDSANANSSNEITKPNTSPAATPKTSPKESPKKENDKTDEDENNNTNKLTHEIETTNTTNNETDDLNKPNTAEQTIDDKFKDLNKSLEEFKKDGENSIENKEKDIGDKLEEMADNLKENVKEMADKVMNVFSTTSTTKDDNEQLENESNEIVVHSESPQKPTSSKKVLKDGESSDETADEDEEPQVEADKEEISDDNEAEANNAEKKDTEGEDETENEPERDPEPEPEPEAHIDEVDNKDDGDCNEENLDNEERDGEGSPTSSLAIEGFVQGDAEDNTVQSQTAAYVHDDEETHIESIIASGDMEQLAQIVLNGDGQKLLNVEATEPEIQAFLKNVPNYMNKIRRVHEAARNGSLLNLQQALDRRKFAVAKDEISPNGATPLHVAVLFGNSDIVRYLSARFPETTTIIDNDGRTALHYAAVINDNGHFYNVLLQLGANPKLVDKMGHTPEDYLGKEELKDTLNYGQLLKRFGAEELEQQLLSDQGQIENPSSQENPIFKTEQGKYLADNLADPLIKALTQVAHKRPNDPLEYLTNYLQRYVSTRNTNGRTITQAAIHSGSSQTNSTVLASSKTSTPPPPAPTQMENQTARMNGHVKYANADSIEEDSMQQLEDYDDDGNDSDAEISKKLEERDEHGQSMLHFACARSHRKGGLIHLIEEAKADITYRDELYRTARDVALQANQLGNAKEIDRYVMSLAIVGDTKPFEHLAISGYDHIIDILDDNETPIIEVVEARGLMELAEYLRTIRPLEELREELHQMIRVNNADRVKEIADGPDGKWLIKAKNYYGRTALHIAILKESIEIVEHFVNRCPEALKIGDNLERTALHYAMGTNIIESISRILIQNGAKRTYKDLKGRQPSYYFMNKADILRLQEEEDENR